MSDAVTVALIAVGGNILVVLLARLDSKKEHRESGRKLDLLLNGKPEKKDE